jgi:hypothetical protein
MIGARDQVAQQRQDTLVVKLHQLLGGDVTQAPDGVVAVVALIELQHPKHRQLGCSLEQRHARSSPHRAPVEVVVTVVLRVMRACSAAAGATTRNLLVHEPCRWAPA